MTKYFAIAALVLAAAATMAGPAAAGEQHRYRVVKQERYVPASDDIIETLFGGPRYYDRQMPTTSAGACAYHRVGPDADAVNDINDHYCGK
ncbi:hypothetical protein FJW05_26955 [Mesorhizobium sp. B2-9-1]|uniref:hypothetical protein n=1 Tax=unclassified Mesorhizobium TaxID=325217 RepID=UPI00112BB6FA|nr:MULTISPECIES: hypothetical protein [unclassified Mesorhizobium]TPI36792.1 hypothetical protein FJW05_26955 [Mesorhizobium sp. B2-9-1]TPJ24285.1 hypothetical protein FJ425_20885 [Mesorhizobium sp. B2-7-2]